MSLNEPAIKTNDLGLATAMVSCGFEVDVVEQAGSGRAVFVFSNTPEIENAVHAYWADTLDVKARYYFDAIKMLKSRIHGGK